EKGLGAHAHEVVDAHGDEVDPDGVVAVGHLGHEDLGAHSIGGGDEQRVAAVAEVGPEQAAEAADLTDHLRPEGGAHVVADAAYGLVARFDVDARRLVGQRLLAPLHESYSGKGNGSRTLRFCLSSTLTR